MKFDILSNIVSSQVEVHKKYGGVYPNLAKREHQKNLVLVLKKTLKNAELLKIFNSQSSILNFQKLKEILEREEILFKKLEKFLKKYQKPKIDAIAVTIGPGLESCLWIGVNFAKALSFYWNLPIIPVNHIEGHILVNFLNNNFQVPSFNLQELFPAICLVASGGHTQLILMRDFGKYKIIGETRDDAAGECFDKIAKILGLGYPGGPIVATKAKKHNKKSRGPASTRLPRPMLKQKNYDFSFSGLKTAVLYNFKKQPLKIRRNEKYIKEMCCESQQAIVEILVKKTIRAAEAYMAKTIILGGGVTANSELRKQFQSAINNQQLTINFLVPSKNFCTDNATMIGVAGYFGWLRGETKPWKNIKAGANLRL